MQQKQFLLQKSTFSTEIMGHVPQQNRSPHVLRCLVLNYFVSVVSCVILVRQWRFFYTRGSTRHITSTLNTPQCVCGRTPATHIYSLVSGGCNCPYFC